MKIKKTFIGRKHYLSKDRDLRRVGNECYALEETPTPF